MISCNDRAGASLWTAGMNTCAEAIRTAWRTLPICPNPKKKPQTAATEKQKNATTRFHFCKANYAAGKRVRLPFPGGICVELKNYLHNAKRKAPDEWDAVLLCVLISI